MFSLKIQFEKKKKIVCAGKKTKENSQSEQHFSLSAEWQESPPSLSRDPKDQNLCKRGHSPFQRAHWTQILHRDIGCVHSLSPLLLCTSDSSTF